MTAGTGAAENRAQARLERGGWSLWFPEGGRELPLKARAELVERALELAAGAGGHPLRRSRHASTYCLRLDGSPAETVDAFVKLLDAESGWSGTLRNLARGSRAERLGETVERLEAAGFTPAPLLMLGEERRGGRAMLVTRRVAGVPLPRFLRDVERAPERKRETLRALGAEIARLHRAGFLHGDLTPYNIFVAEGDPARFVFIDHERTVRARLAWRRRRLRNLVQLCRFELAGMSRADRIRIVDSYADGMGYRHHWLQRRLALMLRARRLRDAGPARLDCARLWRSNRRAV